MTLKEMIENLASVGWPFVPDTFEGRKAALEEIAEAAKLEERRRIEEALPEKRVLRDADYDSCGGDFGESYKCGIDEGFNDCLDQVRSIINPKPNLPTNP